MQKIIVIYLCAFILAACGASASPATAEPEATLATVPTEYAGLTNPLEATAAAAGGQVYRTNCEMCHGPQGHGDGPAGKGLDPRPGNLARIQAQAGDDYLFWRTHDGKPGTAMLGWKAILTDEQIWQTVAFLRTLK